MNTSTAEQALKQRKTVLTQKQAENQVKAEQIKRFRDKMTDLAKLLGIGQEALQVLEDISDAA